jgi:hypothetical protein
MEGSDSHQLVTPPPPAFSSQAAANELNTTAAGIFRGNFVGALDGPYISQFFRQPVPSVSTIIQQRYRSGARCIDYLTSYDEWQVIQTGSLLSVPGLPIHKKSFSGFQFTRLDGTPVTIV